MAPVAERLVELAGRMLHDKWRVSEITEPVVHRLSLDYGSNLGVEPSLRVLKGVHWYTEDLRVGGRRARRKAEVELFSRTMEAVEDQFDLENQVAAQRTLDRLSDQLTKMDMHEVRAMLPMMLLECDADDYRQRFNKSRNSISQQFYRSMRQAGRAAGIIGWMHESE